MIYCANFAHLVIDGIMANLRSVFEACVFEPADWETLHRIKANFERMLNIIAAMNEWLDMTYVITIDCNNDESIARNDVHIHVKLEYLFGDSTSRLFSMYGTKGGIGRQLP